MTITPTHQRKRDGGWRRRTVLRTTAGLAGLAVFGRSSADTVSRRVLLSGNATDGTVTIADATSYEPLLTIDAYPVGTKEDLLRDAIEHTIGAVINAFTRENYLEHANLSPDGRTVYIARGHVGDVVAIDLETQEKRWERSLTGFRADHQTISPDGTYIYTADILADQIDVIDAETGAIIDAAYAPNLPHGVQFRRLPAFDNRPILVNGSLGNMIFPDTTFGDPFVHRLSFIDPTTLRPLQTVSLDEGIRPFSFSPDGRYCYCQESYFHGFHEVDIARGEIIRTKSLPKTEHVPADPAEYPMQAAHHGIGVSGDGKYLCVAATTGWYVAILNREDLSVVKRIDVGAHPYWVETSDDGRFAFVPVRGDNEIVVINYASQEIVNRIPTGSEPHVIETGTIPDRLL
ncbi:YncE family protein [Halocatena halophila]|uniref:YncE family protein n=1 Tax=Halocatena halophila TaxID=2814576 RepID=UPI002ED1A615